jgi:hypothetical protein
VYFFKKKKKKKMQKREKVETRVMLIADKELTLFKEKIMWCP